MRFVKIFSMPKISYRNIIIMFTIMVKKYSIVMFVQNRSKLRTTFHPISKMFMEENSTTVNVVNHFPQQAV